MLLNRSVARRPIFGVQGSGFWRSAEGCGCRGVLCPPRMNRHPRGPFLANPTRVLQRKKEPPRKEKEPPPQHLHKAFLGGSGEKKKQTIFLPPDLFQQMGRAARSRVAFFGGGFAYIPDFGGRLGQARCSAGCWLPAKGEDEVWGRRRRGPERGASDFDINYRKPSSSACKTLSCGLNPKGTGLPPHAPKGGCLTSAGAGCP